MGYGVLPQTSEIHQLSSVHPFGCADDVFYVEFSCEECYTCKKKRYAMLQFFKEKRRQKQIEQELKQQRGMELADVLKKREDPSVSTEEAVSAFNEWWDKWTR